MKKQITINRIFAAVLTACIGLVSRYLVNSFTDGWAVWRFCQQFLLFLIIIVLFVGVRELLKTKNNDTRT